MGMSYDPSHRRPPRQERWPSATPAEGWPSYRDGDAYRSEQADSRYEADRQGAYPAAADYPRQAGYRHAAGGPGDWGYPSSVATDTFPPVRNGYATANGYSGAGYGYASAGNGYAGTVDGYASPRDDYAEVTDGFDGAAGGYGWAQDGNGWAEDGGTWAQDGYGWAEDGYRSGADGFTADLGPGSYTEYHEPMSGDPRLTAPDAGVHPDRWQAEQDDRREARRRGMMVGAVTEVLGTAVAIGVSTLAAGLLKAQTSPVAAMGSVFVDRTPAALRNALIHHFGTHGRTVLLLGMYAVIAFVALVVGVLARRAAAVGVAGIAAFTLVAAFVAITRPAGHAGDVTPAVVGGVAGAAALLWLVRASTPIAPRRNSRGGARRRTR